MKHLLKKRGRKLVKTESEIVNTEVKVPKERKKA